MHIDLYIALFIAAFIIQLLIIFRYDELKDARPLFAIGIAFWILLMVQGLYIEVPYVDSSGIQVQSYTEYGLNAFCLIFIFLNVIYWFAYQFDIRELRKKRLR